MLRNVLTCRERRRAIRKYCLQASRRATHVRQGVHVRFDVLGALHVDGAWLYRRDKYQRKLLWYWVDTNFEGKHREEDAEELSRDLELGESRAKDVALGLSKASVRGGGVPPPGEASEEESFAELIDDDDDNDDDDSRGEGSENTPEKPRKGKKNKARAKASSSRRCQVQALEEELPGEAHLL